MTTIRELHLLAMDSAEKAFFAKQNGCLDKAKELFQEAMQFEINAAEKVEPSRNSEPTRSILLRSAASLANECGEFRQAEKLIAIGLSGDPPDEIAHELRELLEKVNFHYHMEIHGVVLEQNDFQVVFTGKSISADYAQSETIISRLQNIQNLIFRTAERLIFHPYHDSGISSASKKFPLYVTVPRPSSFAITLRLGQNRQIPLPGLDQAPPIIDEIMKCIKMINESEDRKLSEHISDPAYFNNFIGLIQKIAPDGDSIKGVGFSFVKDGEIDRVPLQRNQDSITKIPKKIENREYESLIVKVSGQLRYANSIHEDEIKLVDDSNKTHTIIVPEGMMSDIVKPLWYEKVIVTGKKMHKKILLTDIQTKD
jgi:hypothetical protein